MVFFSPKAFSIAARNSASVFTPLLAANATVGAIVNSMQNDNIADNNRFFITFPPCFICLNGINIKKRFQDMATHDLKAFSYLFGTAQKGRVLLALRCEQCIAPRIGLSSSFSRCIPPSANKAQKRLTASSLMLATSYHCGFCRFRPFWLCVPAFRRVCLFLRHCV